jgi:hypothetical protein
MSHDTNLHFEEEEFATQSGFTTTIDADRSVTVEGDCPRCHGRTSWTFRVEMPGVTTKIGGALATRRGTPVDALGEPPFEDGEEAVVVCSCGSAHRDRPKELNESGCGAYWPVKLRRPQEVT